MLGTQFPREHWRCYSQRLPVVISHHLAQLACGSFWLGGGHVNLKLQVYVRDLIECELAPTVHDVTS